MKSLGGGRASDGLHILKNLWTQKSYLDEQAAYLAANLDDAIQATRDAVPDRRKGYRLGRKPTAKVAESMDELILEKNMLRRWNAEGMRSISDGWARLVAAQVPLFAAQKKEQWGYIDLLGLSANGTPVVIELKRSPKTDSTGSVGNAESPLRMILEAASYAIALQERWNAFQPDLALHLATLQVKESVIRSLEAKPKKIFLAAAAPAAHWLQWLPYTDRGQIKSGWNGLATLLDGFAVRGFPSTFVSIVGDPKQSDSLAAQKLFDLPWQNSK